MDQKELIVGIVGFGNMGSWHKDILGKIEGCKVTGIYDIKESQIIKVRNSGIFAYNSLNDLLADKHINLVLVATPNDLINLLQ